MTVPIKLFRCQHEVPSLPTFIPPFFGPFFPFFTEYCCFFWPLASNFVCCVLFSINNFRWLPFPSYCQFVFIHQENKMKLLSMLVLLFTIIGLSHGRVWISRNCGPKCRPGHADKDCTGNKAKVCVPKDGCVGFRCVPKWGIHIVVCILVIFFEYTIEIFFKSNIVIILARTLSLYLREFW